MNRGLYLGDLWLKVARVGSRREVGKFSFDNRITRDYNSLPQEWMK
jgi:hypothetical protein